MNPMNREGDYYVSLPSGQFTFRIKPHFIPKRAARGECVVSFLTNHDGVMLGMAPEWLDFAFVVGVGVDIWARYRGVYNAELNAANSLFRHTAALRQANEALVEKYGTWNLDLVSSIPPSFEDDEY